MSFLNNKKGRISILPFSFSKKQLAFTLIELIIVISMIAIISVVISLSASSQNSISLDAFSQQIQQDIRYTQTLAVSRHQTVQIQFNNSTYTLTDSSANPVPNSYNSDHFIIPPGMLIALTNASTNAAIANNQFSFNSDGEPMVNSVAMTSPITISITSSTQSKKLTVSPQTGKVDEAP